jgi:hypothetical protein
MKVKHKNLSRRHANMKDDRIIDRLISEGWEWQPGIEGGEYWQIFGSWVAPEGVTELPAWAQR